jgi:two-component sensor histidine kinase
VGLILNELLTNAYKYAFPESKSGHIKVVFQRIEDHYELEVNDNGVGLPADHAERIKKSLGHNLVKGLVRQLEGTIDWQQTCQVGTFVKISFKR